MTPDHFLRYLFFRELSFPDFGTVGDGMQAGADGPGDEHGAEEGFGAAVGIFRAARQPGQGIGQGFLRNTVEIRLSHMGVTVSPAPRITPPSTWLTAIAI